MWTSLSVVGSDAIMLIVFGTEGFSALVLVYNVASGCLLISVFWTSFSVIGSNGTPVVFDNEVSLLFYPNISIPVTLDPFLPINEGSVTVSLSYICFGYSPKTLVLLM